MIGGSSSLGRALAPVLVARGDDVLATWSSQPVEIAGVATTPLDLRDEASRVAFAASPAARGLEIVVVLAAVLPGKALADYDAALMDEVMAVNVTGAARLVQLLMPAMAPGAHVLFVGSIAGTQGSFDPIYAASKAALVGLVKSLATWHGDRVRFNLVAPSLILGSTMHDAMTEERRRHHREASPTGALLGMADLAEIIADLISPAWRHLNGAVIPVDGGRIR